MRIKTYQGGGIVYLPTVNQMGAAQNTAASSGSSESAGKVPGRVKQNLAAYKTAEQSLESQDA